MGLLDDAIREHLELKRRHGADSAEVARQEREILGGEGAVETPEAAYVEPAAPDAAAYAEPVAYEDAAPEYTPAEVDVPIAEAPVTPPPAAPAPAVTAAVDDIFPGTNELLAAGAEGTAAPPPAAPAADPTPAPTLRPPAPADADSETAARSGARRLSDEELAAWRKRLSERADRLAAQRPAAGAGGPATAAGAASTPAPATPAGGAEPPAYWSGNTSGADAGTPPSFDKPAAAAPAPAPEPTQPGVPADFFDAGDADTAFAPEPAPEPVADETDHDVLDDTPDFLQETPEHDRMWFEQKPPRDFDFG